MVDDEPGRVDFDASDVTFPAADIPADWCSAPAEIVFPLRLSSLEPAPHVPPETWRRREGPTNEYLERFIEINGSTTPDLLDVLDTFGPDRDWRDSPLVKRQSMVVQYAWAVPTPEAIERIAALSPIVELGAGGGLWAKLLKDAGARVAPYDLQPYPLLNYQVAYSWAPISKGGPRAALRNGRENWTLLLCWPPYTNPMAHEALLRHKGEHVVYIGEGDGGCTGDEGFHELLEELYEEQDGMHLPQWPGLHDYLSVWRRR